MRTWKRTLSAIMSICLVFSLFTGLNFTSKAAGTYGTLQNGALTENTDGWTIAGDLALAGADAEAGCNILNGDGTEKHLSIWNNSAEAKTFSMSQTIQNMEAGSYTAKVESVGNGATKHNLVLKAHNDTKNTEVKVNIDTKEWNVYVSSSTTALEVAEGDTVTISISGPMEAKGTGDGEWYGIHNIEFEAAPAVEADINVKKVPGLSKDFIHGVDVSTYLSEVQSGVKYKDENGIEKNMFEIFKDAGVNYVRFRVWNCPYRVDDDGKIFYVDEAGNEHHENEVTARKQWIISPDDASFQGAGYDEYFLADGTQVYREGYGAGNCDIDAATEMGKIATYYGMKVLIDFHYSDFWADPAKMKSPKAWEGMTIEQKAAALSDYTKASLKQLKDAGVDVGMVQVGNEINGGMAGEKDWANVSKLLDAGTKAVRASDPNIQIAIHYADPHKENYQTGKAKALNDANIDYDIFASSYYSFWHGSPENLTSVLKTIAETYNKKVMVAEVSYCTTTEDGDGAANVVNASTSPLNYSIDAQGEGQAAAVRDAIAAVSAVGEAGIGTFYWEPAWVPVKNYAGAAADKKAEVLTYNIDKWEKYGSGWASKWSGPEGGGYDPGVVLDKSTHGSQWDNQAMFDFDGKALPSINVYKWVYTGTDGPVRVATVDTATYTMNYKDTPQLPAAVNVNLNNGEVVENVAVTWDTAQVEALKTADFGEYTVNGSLAQFSYTSKGETITVPAGQQKTTCAVTVTGTNLLPNGGFEDGETGWTATAGARFKTTGAGGDAKEGTNFYDAWAENAATDFRVMQTLSADELTSGKYTLFGYYQGTNVGPLSDASGLTALVTYKNGKTMVYTGDIEIPGTWKVFYQAKVPNIVVNQNVASITVISRILYNSGWVVADDFNLMRTDDLTAAENTSEPSSSTTFTVTFKDGETELGTKTVDAGATAALDTAPTKEGYTFDGWDAAVDMVVSDLTVNAKWKQGSSENPKTTYTVTFKDGDTVLKEETVEEGAAATAPTAPTKEGYTFDGWDKAFDNVTSDLTVNAKWKQNQKPPVTQEKKYTVTFDVNGGKALTTKTKTVTAGQTYGTLPDATRAGHAFNGWYTAKTGGQQITASSKVAITADTTLYARWTKIAKPGKVKKPTLKNPKKNTLKISFKKVKGAEGYEIRYATKSNMKGAKKITSKVTSITAKNKKIFKKGKTCYVQVRAFKRDSLGKKIYSKSYSPKAKIKIKK